MARCTRYNIMWKRSVVFSGYSGFLHQLEWPPRYNWNIVESGIKHHNPNPNHVYFVRVVYLTTPLNLNYHDRFENIYYCIQLLTLHIVCKDFRGCFPLAVSLDNMRQSAPSRIALATSATSALVGRGFWIILAKICNTLVIHINTGENLKCSYS